jgi:hypothetical protein
MAYMDFDTYVAANESVRLLVEEGSTDVLFQLLDFARTYEEDPIWSMDEWVLYATGIRHV